MRFFLFIFFLILSFFLIKHYFFSNEIKQEIKIKQETYNEPGNPYFADVAVALSINLGTRLNELHGNSIKLYQSLMDIDFMLSHKEVARDKIISSNIELLNEYVTLLKTNVMELLGNSVDRAEVLDSYIAQLNYMGKVVKSQIEYLKKQAEELEIAMKEQASLLVNLKKEIKSNLKYLNQFGIIENVNKYLDIREKYTYTRTYLYLINKFIDYYIELNNYNRKLIAQLISAREPLIKGEPIKINKYGAEILKKYELLIIDGIK